MCESTFNLTIVSQKKDIFQKTKFRNDTANIFLSFVCNYVSNISTMFYEGMEQEKNYRGNLRLIVMEVKKSNT